MKALLLASISLFACCAAKAEEITVAAVNNPDMVTMQQLAPAFEKANPDITVKFVILPDNVLRQNVTQDVAVKGGRYDIATISPYEVQSSWVINNWLVPLTPMFSALPTSEQSAYDVNDIIPSIRAAVSVKGQLYALPFYGESSFTMYRKDLFEKAGLTMPPAPTWDDIRTDACKLNDPKARVYGIVMKGVPDFGQLAPFITFMHSYGAKWFALHPISGPAEGRVSGLFALHPISGPAEGRVSGLFSR